VIIPRINRKFYYVTGDKELLGTYRNKEQDMMIINENCKYQKSEIKNLVSSMQTPTFPIFEFRTLQPE
jgi:hypothetical protein